MKLLKRGSPKVLNEQLISSYPRYVTTLEVGEVVRSASILLTPDCASFFDNPFMRSNKKRTSSTYRSGDKDRC